jgi:hypothetical protein
VIFGKQFAGLGHLPVEMRRAGLVVERVEDGDGPELRIRKAAARRRIVSGGWIWPGRRELSCYFKYMARGRIPEFESYHPSHAVVSFAVKRRPVGMKRV